MMSSTNEDRRDTHLIQSSEIRHEKDDSSSNETEQLNRREQHRPSHQNRGEQRDKKYTIEMDSRTSKAIGRRRETGSSDIETNRNSKRSRIHSSRQTTPMKFHESDVIMSKKPSTVLTNNSNHNSTNLLESKGVLNGLVFMSKKQRETLKQKEEEERIKQEKEKEDNLYRKRKDLEKYRPAPSDSSSRRPISDYESRDDSRRDSHRERRTDNRRQRESNQRDSNVRRQAMESEVEQKDNSIEIQRAWDKTTESSLADLKLVKLQELDVQKQRRDLEQIRDHYLGLKKEKKRMQKPSEKFRNIFNFEWDVNEDTAKGDNNDLYLSRVEPQLLFGRGFRAGIDVREQRRHNNFYDELIRRRSDIAGEELPNVDESKQALIRSRDIEQGDPNRRHWTDKTRDEMTDRDWRIFREDFEIYIKGGRVPPPVRRWEESGLPEDLLKGIHNCGYEKPTPIQMQAIPIALEQRDLIGIAETGSGKTAAFVLPMLTYVKLLPPLNHDTSQDGPYALILAPSRELALQIEDETKKFASFCNCRTVSLVGGRDVEEQGYKLRVGVEIVIGTPGRVKDCLERSYTVLNQCNYVVLDEADRMIDLGFEEIVNWILDQIPSSNLKSEDEDKVYQQELEAKAGYRRYRLTQMFSATMPPAVERLARKYLKSPALISIGDPGAGKRAIEQRLEFMPEGKKRQRLEQILQGAEPPIMVFVNQKKVADVIAKTLQKMGYNASSLHGGKAQDMRELSLNDFKKGTVEILVATDVAGRGIDVEGVQLVINFDMPKDIGSYTHRIGRTGRAGKKGCAVSFVTEDDSSTFYDLKQLLVSTNNVIPHELANHPATKTKPGTTPAASTQTSTSRGMKA